MTNTVNITRNEAWRPSATGLTKTFVILCDRGLEVGGGWGE